MSIEEFDEEAEAYEKFKLEWRKDRVLLSDTNDLTECAEVENSFNFIQHLKSPIGLSKKRRTSDSFKITPTKFVQTTDHQKIVQQRSPSSSCSRLMFKNKNEAVNSIRLYMSSSMAEAYETELRRRFTERQMSECVPFDTSTVLIPAEMASFRWKFQGSPDFDDVRLFILDSEALWDDFIANKRFNDLLQAYNEPNVFLYFINWKRAAQKHSTQLNRQFKHALNTSSETIRLVPVNELENEFFLSAAKMRLQVNFSGASSGPQSLVDLIDFVIEMTRVVALKGYMKQMLQSPTDDFDVLNLTLSRDVKVKSGKDARDCWIRTLCQLPRVTAPLAEVIATKYPSFCALMNAYEFCTDSRDGEGLLAELKLDGRRIGPIISSRIYSHFQ